MLWSDAIPTYTFRDNNAKTTSVRIVAGQIENERAPSPAPDSWAADVNNEVAIWAIKMEPGAQWKLPTASSSVNRSLYFYQGESIQIADKEFTSYKAIELHAGQEVVLKNGTSASSLLLLQGNPINEPVVQHGPFVVNSQSEIQEVFSEYQRTQFGGWPWSSHEHVHPREKTRFAKYPDGREETKSLDVIKT